MKLRYKRPFFNWLAQLFQKVSGIPPLVMPRAVAGGLKEVTAYGGCGLNGIPSEYTELDSLTGDGNAYIDTGLVPDDSFGYKINISSPDVTADRFVFGCCESSSTNTRCGYGYTNTAAYYGWGSYYLTGGYSYNVDTFYEVSCNFKNDRCGKVDGTIRKPSLGELPTITKSFLLFAFKTGDAARSLNHTTVKSAVFTRGTEIIMDLVPVKRKSDNELGMYDRVSGNFLTNAGTGTFVAGTAVTPSPDKPCEIWCNNGKLIPYLNAEGSSTQDGTPSPDNPVEIQNYTQGNMVLRGVGDYKDVYNSSTKSITRKIGVKVFDGTESWICHNDSGKVFRLDGEFNDLAIGIDMLNAGLSSHCQITNIYDTLNFLNGTFRFTGLRSSTDSNLVSVTNGTRIYLCNKNVNYEATGREAVSLKAWLSEQYQNGTPVVVYYPLAAETTETWNDVACTEGTQETIAVGNSSATAEYLLKTTSYGRTFTDQHDLVRGTVLRNCRIVVLTGQENNIAYVDSPSTLASRFRLILSDMYYKSGVDYGSACLTSHFQGRASKEYGVCYSYRTRVMFLWTYGATTQEFKAWLADQYAVGTPVIVIYPLATPVTEHAAPQALNTVAGTNTLEITQASLAGLKLEAEYKRH